MFHMPPILRHLLGPAGPPRHVLVMEMAGTHKTVSPVVQAHFKFLSILPTSTLAKASPTAKSWVERVNLLLQWIGDQTKLVQISRDQDAPGVILVIQG